MLTWSPAFCFTPLETASCVRYIVRVKNADEHVRCTHCGSPNVRRHRWSGGWFILPLLITGIPFLIPSKRFRCFSCSKDFRLGDGTKGDARFTAKPAVPERTARLVALAAIAIIVLILLFS
jgi:hypothetical protein